MKDMHFANQFLRGYMKNQVLFSLFTGAMLFSAAPAFSHGHHHHDTVVIVNPSPVVVAPAPIVVAPAPIVMADPGPSVMLVQDAPPAPQVEVIPAAPNQEAYWVGGCWKWNNGWTWSPGYYVQRPHPAAVWVPGVWVKHHHRHGWYYSEGHWQ